MEEACLAQGLGSCNAALQCGKQSRSGACLVDGLSIVTKDDTPMYPIWEYSDTGLGWRCRTGSLARRQRCIRSPSPASPSPTVLAPRKHRHSLMSPCSILFQTWEWISLQKRRPLTPLSTPAELQILKRTQKYRILQMAEQAAEALSAKPNLKRQFPNGLGISSATSKAAKAGSKYIRQLSVRLRDIVLRFRHTTVTPRALPASMM